MSILSRVLETGEALLRRTESLRLALENISMLGRVAIAYKSRGGEEDWKHVLRICREVGIEGSILRQETPASAAPLPGDGWTYCHEALPSAPGTYQVSVAYPPGCAPAKRLWPQCLWTGAEWERERVYAWRPCKTAKLTTEALEFLQRKGGQP